MNLHIAGHGPSKRVKYWPEKRHKAVKGRSEKGRGETRYRNPSPSYHLDPHFLTAYLLSISILGLVTLCILALYIVIPICTDIGSTEVLTRNKKRILHKLFSHSFSVCIYLSTGNCFYSFHLSLWGKGFMGDMVTGSQTS